MDKKNKEFFKEAVGSIFESYPFIKNFSWRQYTPYFNDGDECVFRACTDDIEINGEEVSEWQIKERIKTLNTPGVNEANKALLADLQSQKKVAVKAENYVLAEKLKSQISNVEYKIVDESELEELENLIIANNAIQEVLGCFEDDILKSLFGDHVKITVFKNKVVKEEYEHD